MACPTTPLSCLDPVNIFAGVYNPKCGGFADPSNFQAERAIFKSGFDELIQNYGVELNYYINGFNLSAMNMLYGEHTTQEYSGPHIIKAYLKLEEGISISRYGVEASDELIAYFSIQNFTNVFTPIASAFYIENGQRIEPKSDDLLEVTALGCDRPGGRGPKIFRISEVLDQDVNSGLNPMLGHYVFKVVAKRYEPDGSTNSPRESGDDQVYDNTISGKLSSTMFPSLTADEKVYDQNADEISQTEIYDMNKNDNSMYGEYY